MALRARLTSHARRASGATRVRGALAAVFTLGALAMSCAPAPEDAPVEQTAESLLASPTTLPAGGAELSLDVEAWRSFQPTVGSTPGDPLIAVIRVRATGGGIPGALTLAGVWLVRGGEVVRGEAREEQPRAAGAREVEYVLRDGPAWAPGDSIDVVARLTGVPGTGGPSALLRAPRVPIARVD